MQLSRNKALPSQIASAWIAASLALLLCIALQRVAHADEIDTYFDTFAAEWVKLNPNLATSTRYFTGAEQDALERQLTPQTREWQLRRAELAKRGIAGLKKFDTQTLTSTQKLSADLMKWQLQSNIDAAKYLDYGFPLDQFQGANVTLVETFTLRHPLLTAHDAENFVARLSQFSARLDEAAAEAKRLIERKRVPPRFIVQSTIASMRTFSSTLPTQNPIAIAFRQKTTTISAMSADRRASLQSQVETIIGEQIYPAWQRALSLLEALMPETSNDAGLWRYAEGKEVYANALQRFTTTTLTAEQIHQIGLQQVARIEKRMDEILKSLGRTDGAVKERMEKLDADLRYPNAGSEESRAQIMKDVEAIMADAMVRSRPMFERTPKGTVIAQAFPKFRENAAAANYNSGALDGSRPAIFQIPLRDSRMTRLGLRTLVYHETIPGHHFQIALEAENKALPRFRQTRVLGGISALSEGWGLYAERLAAENDWYAKDPEGLLGQLSAELFRARRLVVDTGLHAKHWTRQQAIDFGIEASEVERYVVNPGQACSYMIGQLKLIELRDRARAKLGNKFSFKEFHSVVLDTGTVPLNIMEREVDRYIREKTKT